MNEYKPCKLCGNNIPKTDDFSGYCGMGCVDKEIKGVKKYFIVSSICGVVLALIVVSSIRVLTSVNKMESFSIPLIILHLIIFLLPFGRYDVPAYQAGVSQFGRFSIIHFNPREAISKHNLEVSAGLISYVGPINMVYHCVKLFKLLRIRNHSQ
jgi:predicted nucleic acid-binding Zn ribbon protein